LIRQPRRQWARLSCPVVCPTHKSGSAVLATSIHITPPDLVSYHGRKPPGSFRHSPALGNQYVHPEGRRSPGHCLTKEAVADDSQRAAVNIVDRMVRIRKLTRLWCVVPIELDSRLQAFTGVEKAPASLACPNHPIFLPLSMTLTATIGRIITIAIPARLIQFALIEYQEFLRLDPKGECPTGHPTFCENSATFCEVISPIPW